MLGKTFIRLGQNTVVANKRSLLNTSARVAFSSEALGNFFIVFFFFFSNQNKIFSPQ
jgi:hypothetical protein